MPRGDGKTNPNERTMLPLALTQLQAGQNQAAVEVLATIDSLFACDPSRLINRLTADTHLGLADRAAVIYRTAMGSPLHDDLESANGPFMEARQAARAAVANMQAGKLPLALADQ